MKKIAGGITDFKWVVFVAVFAIAAFYVSGAVTISDNTNVAVPATNGTSSSTNISGLMQAYVGFYGTMSMQVRRTSAAGNVMYNSRVTSGRVYWARTGVTPQFASTQVAPNNSHADGNISLTGYYITGNHFVNNGTVCGYANTNFINSTDNYSTGLLRDNATATANYYFCTNVSAKTSGNGFGEVDYQVVVPKTSVYTAYDVWFDLE